MNNRMIDKLVALHIMDWELSEYNSKMIVPPITDERINWTGIWSEDGIPQYLPYYSTNIKDAWRVIDNLRNGWTEFEVGIGEDIYSFEIHSLVEDNCDIKIFRETHESLPMAICHAALKYKGVSY